MKLDADACFRVRDLPFEHPDLRFFFTDGWLIFAKPVNGQRVAALYVGTETTDDAEVLVRPSNRAERASLAHATGSPNMDEHFKMAAFLFTGGESDALYAAAVKSAVRKDPTQGMLFLSQWGDVLRNLASSLEVRIVHDLLSGAASRNESLFFAAVAGKDNGNFDIYYDPLEYEQVVLGKVAHTTGEPNFEVWTSFRTRAALRAGTPVPTTTSLSNYRIEATIQPNLEMEVVTRATILAPRRLEGAIAIDISPDMEVTSAKVAGENAELFRREAMRESLKNIGGNETILIGLKTPIEKGQTRELEIHHHGQVIHQAGDGVFFVADRVNWYPTRGYNFATYDLTFRLPKQYLLAAPGDPVEERVDGDWRIVHRRTNTAVRNAGFNIGSYEHVSVKRGKYEVEMYANTNAEPFLSARGSRYAVIAPPAGPRSPRDHLPPGVIELTPKANVNPSTRMDAMGADIAEEFEWMANQFGPPPLNRIAVAPIPGFFGQGFPGLIYLSTVSYLDEAARKAVLHGDPTYEPFYSFVMHAHETAHQWWGNLVTPATYHDEWVSEALANYTALLLLERKRGPKALEAILEDYRKSMLLATKTKGTVESSGPLTWGFRLRENVANDPWRIITYGKGSWVIHMLRCRLGDEAFLRMLAGLRKQYEYKMLSTDQFRAVVTQYLPKTDPDPTLENFFDDWVYGTGIPQIEMKSSTHGKAPAVTLNITVKQSGVPDDFVTEVPVEIYMPGVAKPMVRWVHATSEPTLITVKLRSAPKQVLLAPGLSVLMRSK
jgi:hypothetical protein